MKWYPLTVFQVILLLIFVGIADLFTISQKYFVPEPVRPFTYVVFVIVLMHVYFLIVRPDRGPMVLAQTLSVILGVITLILVLVQDVLLASTLSWKTVIIFLGAVLGPVIAGYLYPAVHGSLKN
jgi:hypothetical protein